MTKLIETDEEVEKAGKGMIPRGGTSKLQLKLRSTGKGSPRTRRYLLNRTKGGPIHGEAAGRRRGVYKANEPSALEALDSAIEKARGLMPGKVGRAILARRTGRTAGKILARADAGNMRLGDGHRYHRLTRIQSRLTRK